MSYWTSRIRPAIQVDCTECSSRSRRCSLGLSSAKRPKIS